MKLICDVQVLYRLQPNIKRRTLKSTLALCKEPKSNELSIIHSSSANITGTKYKVKNNIDKIHTRFIDEGKTTICFKEPQHNLLIQCDRIQLKVFLKTLKLALNKTVPLKDLNISNYSGTCFSAKNLPPKKLTITHRSNYPKNGFPRTLEVLIINRLSKCRFDTQILNLHQLKVLNLSDNCLTELPFALSEMCNLKELILTNNQLGNTNQRKWKWFTGNLAKTLRLLDVSYNKIKIFPIDIINLFELIQLQINNNYLVYVPPGIQRMKKLKFLNLSKNKLQVLPSSIRNMKLELLDVADNKFEYTTCTSKKYSIKKVSSLLNISAQVILKCNFYFDSELIPSTLVSYLHDAHYCLCGNPVYEKKLSKTLFYNISKFNGTLITSKSNIILLECIFVLQNASILMNSLYQIFKYKTKIFYI